MIKVLMLALLLSSCSLSQMVKTTNIVNNASRITVEGVHEELRTKTINCIDPGRRNLC